MSDRCLSELALMQDTSLCAADNLDGQLRAAFVDFNASLKVVSLSITVVQLFVGTIASPNVTRASTKHCSRWSTCWGIAGR
jgi:hypothetical protein